MKMQDQRELSAKFIGICGMAIVFFISMSFACRLWNPDSDTYWLISTGKWIVENKGVPSVNPWNVNEDLAVIVQQPLCAVLNYLFYSACGIERMWILAVLENILLLLVSFFCAKQFGYSRSIKDSETFFIVAETISASCGLITTRPYQLTIGNMILLLCVFNFYKKSNKYFLSLFLVAVITLFQANYQMASLIAIPCFLSCYFAEYLIVHFTVKSFKNDKVAKEILKWMGFYFTFAVTSLCNPYGKDGVLYLFKSKEAISLVKNMIYETKEPTILSLCNILIWGCFFLCICLKKAGNLNWSYVLLCAGSCFASSIAIRNSWMLYICIIIGYAKIKGLTDAIQKCAVQKSNYKYHFPLVLLRCFCLLGCIFACITFIKTCFISKESNIENLFGTFYNEINELPKDAKIYTSFNTGGYVEYLGRKCYMDARPELYHPNITKKDNILKEWYELEYSDKADIDNFIKSHDFSYYFISKHSCLHTYLKYQNANLLLENEKFALYEVDRT